MSISRKKLQRIIQEEIGLVLISPLPIEVEPRDVTDAFHPAEIVPREDAWAGGDNLNNSTDWQKVLDMIKEELSKAAPFGSGMKQAKLEKDQKDLVGHT